MTTESELLKLKEKIREAETAKAQGDGAIKQLFKRLKDEFSLKTSKEAKARIATLRKKKEKLQGEIEMGLAKVQEEYDVA